MTRGRGGSGAEVSVNPDFTRYLDPINAQLLISCISQKP